MATSQQNMIARIIQQGLADWQQKSNSGAGLTKEDATAVLAGAPMLRPGPTTQARMVQEAVARERLQKMKAWADDLDNAFVTNPLFALTPQGRKPQRPVGMRPIRAANAARFIHILGEMLAARRAAIVRQNEPPAWRTAPPPLYGPALSLTGLTTPTPTAIGSILEGTLLNNGHLLAPGIVGGGRLASPNARMTPMGEIVTGNNRPPFADMAAAYLAKFPQHSPAALGSVGEMVREQIPTTGARPFPLTTSALQKLLTAAGLTGPLYPPTAPWMHRQSNVSDIYTSSGVKVWRGIDLAQLGLRKDIALLAPEGSTIHHPITNELLQKGPHGRWHRISGFGLLEGE